MKVGVLAMQGDFAKHTEAFGELGLDTDEIRSADELEKCDGLVIPGGESTAVGMLLERFGLGAAIAERARSGMPVWGTCMGMILMAKRVEGRQDYSLGLLDMTVKRNAFGSQVHSFEDVVDVAGFDDPVPAVFIRAPVVTQTGAGVEVLAEYKGHVVAVRSGCLIGTSFHPELTDDRRFHAWFGEIIGHKK